MTAGWAAELTRWPGRARRVAPGKGPGSPETKGQVRDGTT